MKKSKAIKVIMAILCVIMVIGSLSVCAFAEKTTNASLVSANAEAADTITDTMSVFASYVVDAFRVVGVLIGVYAVAQFAMALQDDNVNQKQKSIITLVIGMILIFVKNLAQYIVDAADIAIDLNQGFLG